MYDMNEGHTVYHLLPRRGWTAQTVNVAPDQAKEQEANAGFFLYAKKVVAVPNVVAAHAVAVREALEVILANARVVPDPDMEGTTDCYAVPLDDIEAARRALDEED